jgi:hypothetical protein
VDEELLVLVLVLVLVPVVWVGSVEDDVVVGVFVGDDVPQEGNVVLSGSKGVWSQLTIAQSPNPRNIRMLSPHTSYPVGPETSTVGWVLRGGRRPIIDPHRAVGRSWVHARVVRVAKYQGGFRWVA